MPDEYCEVQPSAVETLLVSGSIDYSTSSQFATGELLPALSNGRQVILPEFGHFDDVWRLQPEATRRLLAAFFDTGEVDASGFTYQPMDFHVQLGFPAIARIALGVLGIIVLGLVFLARLIVQRMRRYKTAPPA